MSNVEEGFKAAIIGALLGSISSILFNNVLRTLGFWGLVMAMLYNILSIISFIELIENMTYWSITYLVGWFIGLLLIFHLMEPLEMILYILVASIFLILKAQRRF
jgi:uncharacterized membrane protein